MLSNEWWWSSTMLWWNDSSDGEGDWICLFIHMHLLQTSIRTTWPTSQTLTNRWSGMWTPSTRLCRRRFSTRNWCPSTISWQPQEWIRRDQGFILWAGRTLCCAVMYRHRIMVLCMLISSWRDVKVKWCVNANMVLIWLCYWTHDIVYRSAIANAYCYEGLQYELHKQFEEVQK